MRDFLLQLAEPGDARDGGVARKAANRIGRNRSAPLEVTSRRPGYPSERIDAGRDDELGPSDGTSSTTTPASAAYLLERIRQTLAHRALVTLPRLSEGFDRGADRGSCLSGNLTLDRDKAVDRLADVQIATGMRPVGFGHCRQAIDLVLKILGYGHELTRVHCFGGLQERRFGLANLGGAEVLSGPGHRHGVLVTDLTASQSFFRPRELFELVGHFDALGGSTARKFALDA